MSLTTQQIQTAGAACQTAVDLVAAYRGSVSDAVDRLAILTANLKALTDVGTDTTSIHAVATNVHAIAAALKSLADALVTENANDVHAAQLQTAAGTASTQSNSLITA